MFCSIKVNFFEYFIPKIISQLRFNPNNVNAFRPKRHIKCFKFIKQKYNSWFSETYDTNNMVKDVKNRQKLICLDIIKLRLKTKTRYPYIFITIISISIRKNN